MRLRRRPALRAPSRIPRARQSPKRVTLRQFTCDQPTELPEDFVMADMGSFTLLSVAVFLGAFVSGFSGFAFSAVAGAILLHTLLPIEAVPLMMACSVGVQSISLWSLRADIQWKRSLVLVVGGLVGVPIAVWLLQTADTQTFRQMFGVAVAIYAGYMLFRPNFSGVGLMSRSRNALVGFGGGLIGGLTAMPGALPTIWCDLHGMPKKEQRGLVQPFITAMQVFALALMLVHRDLSFKIAVSLLQSVPAMIAGTLLGIIAFRNVSDQLCRRVILVILMLSGALLLV
jgi:uncharacterized membrane protein YfcA